MSMFEFCCDRCDTHADHHLRSEVQTFAEHHYRTVHPLFIGPVPRAALPVIRPKRRRLLGARQLVLS